MDEVEVFEDKAGEFRWRRQSENGRVVAVSGEGFTTKFSAVEAARRENPDAHLDLDVPEPEGENE